MTQRHEQPVADERPSENIAEYGRLSVVLFRGGGHAQIIRLWTPYAVVIRPVWYRP
jgi:hypothetical protein